MKSIHDIILIQDAYRRILKLTNEELDAIDMSAFKINDNVPAQWFYGLSGREHYRLLAHISSMFEYKTLVDVGTYQGSSALALSASSYNRVKSFDLFEQPHVTNIKKDNIEFILNDVRYAVDILKETPVIMFDVDHDGIFEDIFYKHLIDIEYKGIMIVDDINLNADMLKFWASITQTKADITHIGHWSGTGIVLFL
jgi:predicted O-methyltransferase YrrM